MFREKCTCGVDSGGVCCVLFDTISSIVHDDIRAFQKRTRLTASLQN